MILELRVKNFRKLTDSTFHFTQGLNSILGRNESGKTTTLEAILYGFYGSTSLRDSVDATVQWGKKPAEMLVEVDAQFDGKVFTFKRGKSVAEVICNGEVIVTGQRDVTEFAATKLGATADLASNLMLAGQNQLRGALSKGPTAAANMVETLADFEFFDTLFSRMSDKLELGSDKAHKEALEEATKALEELKGETKKDTASLKTKKVELQNQVSNLESEVKAKSETAYDIQKELEAAKKVQAEYDKVYARLEALEETKSTLEKDIGELERSLNSINVTKLEEELKDLEGYQAQFKLKAEIEKAKSEYAAFDITEYSEMSKEGLEAVINRYKARREEISLGRHELLRKIEVLKGQIQEDTNCSACGQLLQDHEEIKLRNEQAKEAIEQFEVSIETLEKEADAVGNAIAEHQGTKFEDANKLEVFIAKYKNLFDGGYFVADYAFFPPKVTLVKELSDYEDKSEAISNIKETLKEHEHNRRLLERQTETLNDLMEDAVKLRIELGNHEVDGIDKMEVNLFNAQEEVTKVRETLYERSMELQKVENEIISAEQFNTYLQNRLSECENKVATLTEQIKRLAYNNALMKKVRSARPAVTDKLWNLVLAAVSRFFSEMRGQQSVVTKDVKGFKVDGRAVESLSGSTLDILALALRVALTKTFLPNTSLMMLDEAASAADSERTLAMLSFLRGAGFNQVIMVTHDQVSETLANSVVYLDGETA